MLGKQKQKSKCASSSNHRNQADSDDRRTAGRIQFQHSRNSRRTRSSGHDEHHDEQASESNATIPRRASKGLKKVEELARKGLSILIAPEGTRLDTIEVGPFEKGPFRIAMSAGIPIVPIVIRNAKVVAAHNSSTFNPGLVDVVVFPPIPVDDWTHDNLPERIAEVRDLYLDTLKD